MSLLKKVGAAVTLLSTLGLGTTTAWAHHHDNVYYNYGYDTPAPPPLKVQSRADYDRAMAACGGDHHCKKRVHREYHQAQRRGYRF